MTLSLRIHLLGEFSLFVNGQPLTGLNRPRQQALLAYLLLHRLAPQPRQQIAFSFWPDTSESQAYTNLRKLFFQLRQALPDADSFLTSNSYSLGWRNDAPFNLDVAELEETLDTLQKEAMPVPATVARVATLYRGEMLPICYDEWVLPMRRRLHERVMNTLTQALPGLEAQREYQIALQTADYLLRLDPLHEAAYRHLMQVRGLRGDRAGALRAYHECVTMLERELGVSPALETQALYQQLLKSDGRQAEPVNVARVQPREHLPLVGRVQEWQTLQQAWQETSRGGPQLVTVWGEAGVGKTRLVEEVMQWAKLRPGAVAYGRAYAAEGALAYAPLTEWLRSETLYKGVAQLEGLWQTEIARLLPEILTERPHLSPPALMNESWQRQRFFEALARAVMAAPPPLLLVLDDMQWCDAEMLAWLRYLLHFAPQAPLLVVGTVRSEEVGEGHPYYELAVPLQRMGQYRRLELAPLNLEETALLAGHVTGEKRDDPRDGRAGEWAAQLYQETEGNPLFVVEMVRAGIVAGHGSGQEGQAAALPSTVQAVIAARLAQLSPPALQMAQLAATIGRSFTVEVLAAASNIDVNRLVQALDELWQRRIVRERSNGYDFSHDKIREGAYAAITPMRRRLLHRQVADGLERLYGQSLDEIAGQLATHYRQAEETEKALRYLVQAGDHPRQLSAKHEALRYYDEALALAQGEVMYSILAKRAKIYLDLYQGREAVADFQRLVDHARQRDTREQEVTFLLGLANGYYLVALDAQGAEAAEKTRMYFEAAQALARELGDKRSLVLSLLLPIWHFWTELREQALANSQEALALSRELGDEELILDSKLALLYNTRDHAQPKIGDEVIAELEARQDLDRLNQATFYLMWIHYNLGNYKRAVSICNAGIALAAKLGVLPVQYPTLKAFALLRLGRYREAWESLQEEIADEAHRLARAFKATGVAMYLYEIGAYARAAAIFEQMIEEAQQLRRGWLWEWARIWLVRSLAQADPPDWTKATEILAAADPAVLSGLDQWRALVIALQAEIELGEGRPELALRQIQTADAIMAANEFQGDRAAGLELQARVLLKLGQPNEALVVLQVAAEIASNCGALSNAWRIQATLAQALAMVGQLEAAHQAWQKAAEIIRALAANIGDGDLRQVFVTEAERAAVLARAQ